MNLSVTTMERANEAISGKVQVFKSIRSKNRAGGKMAGNYGINVFGKVAGIVSNLAKEGKVNSVVREFCNAQILEGQVEAE